jgi:hypothetical protein
MCYTSSNPKPNASSFVSRVSQEDNTQVTVRNYSNPMVYTHARYAHFQGITDLYVQSSIGFTRMKGGQPKVLGENSPTPTCLPSNKQATQSAWT